AGGNFEGGLAGCGLGAGAPRPPASAAGLWRRSLRRAMGVSCTPTESSTFNTVVNSGDAFSFQYRLVRDKPVSRAIFETGLIRPARTTLLMARRMSLLSRVWNASVR